LQVEDLGSANGTLLFPPSETDPSVDDTQSNEQERRLAPWTPVQLAVGDTLRLGSALLIVERREPPVAHVTMRPASWPTPNGDGPAVLLDPEMKRLYELATRAAASEISVLILGETGVGKEVMAETIHRRSPRSAGPFLRLNCAALSESLLESELFGHERGAFTGAMQAKAGLLESTNGGTVFLDEIGELPLSTQVKLLRVLEERMVRRVGSTKARPIDVRFVTATNRDVLREVSNGTFRGDLYFRINGVTLHVPPLRDRKPEIVPLARYFLAAACRKSNVREPAITQGALKALEQYSWPGNIRELKNVMERAVFLSGGELGADLVPVDESVPRSRSPEPEPEPASASDWGSETTGVHNSFALGLTADEERERILRALNVCGGNQTRAAKMLGVSRRTLLNRLDDYALPRPKKSR
jgi:transcriptional regulator with PAS, ATPase and Fis domain